MSLYFEDAIFETAVRSALKKPNEPLTPEDLQNIKALYIADRESNSISIPWFLEGDSFNMKFPDLMFNSQNSKNGHWIEDLKLFKHIVSLHIYGTTKDLSFLNDFTSLNELYVSGTMNKDWTFIENLLPLRFLYINKAYFSNLTPISRLCKKQDEIMEKHKRQNKNSFFLDYLRNINLSNCQIEDITPLSHCRYITELDLSYNNISDLKPLKAMEGPYILSLRYNNITDISPLRDKTDIYYINLRHNKISDISIFKNFKDATLSRLFLEHNQIIDYSATKDIYLVDYDFPYKKPGR